MHGSVQVRARTPKTGQTLERWALPKVAPVGMVRHASLHPPFAMLPCVAVHDNERRVRLRHSWRDGSKSRCVVPDTLQAGVMQAERPVAFRGVAAARDDVRLPMVVDIGANTKIVKVAERPTRPEVAEAAVLAPGTSSTR